MPLLVEAGIVGRIDVVLLRLAAISYSEIERCQRVTAKEGLFSIGSRGQVRGHAATRVQAQATQTLLSACDRLGIGPIARARLGLAVSAAHSHQAMTRALDAEIGPHHRVDAQVIDADCIALPGA